MKTHIMLNWRDLCEEVEAAPRTPKLAHQITRILTAQLVTRGRAIRIPRDPVLTFRVQRPLDVAVPHRGRDRDGRHYHDPNTDPQQRH
jgi:hypothetical protein